MSIQRAASILILTAMTPACAAQSSVTTGEAVSRVDECKRGYAFVPAAFVDRSRTTHTGFLLRAINDAAWFATDCPVPLPKRRTPHIDCVGKPKLELFLTKMSVVKDPQHPDSFRVSLETPAPGSTAISFDAQPFHSGPPDVEPSVDMLRGTDSAGRRFFIYLDDALPYGTGLHSTDLYKTYWIEMFYPDPSHPGGWMCEDHMPDKNVTDTAAGVVPAPKIWEGGVGGGTEPKR